MNIVDITAKKDELDSLKQILKADSFSFSTLINKKNYYSCTCGKNISEHRDYYNFNKNICQKRHEINIRIEDDNVSGILKWNISSSALDDNILIIKLTADSFYLQLSSFEISPGKKEVFLKCDKSNNSIKFLEYEDGYEYDSYSFEEVEEMFEDTDGTSYLYIEDFKRNGIGDLLNLLEDFFEIDTSIQKEILLKNETILDFIRDFYVLLNSKYAFYLMNKGIFKIEKLSFGKIKDMIDEINLLDDKNCIYDPLLEQEYLNMPNLSGIIAYRNFNKRIIETGLTDYYDFYKTNYNVVINLDCFCKMEVIYNEIKQDLNQKDLDFELFSKFIFRGYSNFGMNEFVDFYKYLLDLLNYLRYCRNEKITINLKKCYSFKEKRKILLKNAFGEHLEIDSIIQKPNLDNMCKLLSI